MSLRARLLILVLAVVIPSVGVMQWQAWEVRRNAEKALQQELLRIAKGVAVHQAQIVSSTRSLFSALALLPEVWEHDPIVCQRILSSLKEANPIYANLVVVDPNGDAWCGAVPELANYADRDWFKAALETKSFVVGGYVFGRVTRQPLMVLAQAVLDEQNKVKAILSAGVDLAWLEEQLQGLSLPQGAAVFVIDPAGLVLAQSGWPGDLVGSPCPLTRMGHEVGEEPVLLTASGPDGESWVYVAVPFSQDLRGIAHVLVALPAKIAFAPARAAFLWATILVLAVILGAGILAWVWARQLIRVPVTRLTALAERLGRGEFWVRSGVAPSRTELGRLAQALDQTAQSLEELEEKRLSLEHSLAQFVQVSPVILYTLRPDDLRPIWISPNIREILGYTPEEAQEPGWWQSHVHPEDLEKAQVNRAELLAAGRTVAEYRFRTKEGKWIWLRHELRVVRDKEGKPLVIVGAWSDITERKESEEKIAEQLQIISALYASAQRLVAPADLQTLAQEVCRTCVEVFGLQLAWIGWAEEDGNVRVLGQYPVEHPYPRMIRVRWDDTAEGQGPTGRAIREGMPHVTADILGDPRYAEWREAARAYGFRSSAAFPLLRGERAFASLNLYSSQPGFFREEKLSLFQALANLAAGALEKARLLTVLERRLREIQALRHIDLAITGSLDPRLTLRILLEEVTQQLQVDAAAVFLLDPGGTVLRCAGARGFRNPEAIERMELGVATSIAGRAVTERKVVAVPDISRAELPPSPSRDLLFSEGFTTVYAAPMIAKGRVLGVLETFHREPRKENSDWFALLEALASQAAIAVDNARLFADLEGANLELRLAYDATIEAMARALEFRDLETEGHSQRVTELTLKLARRMGMTEEELVHVRRGALLHDIGKLAIPDSILLKPGKLTEEEWAIMKKHPEYAYTMLYPIRYLRPALDIPYSHHERWDGKGYPRGLKGEEIPLAARIFAVVDAWDAMRSDRPYRKALPVEEALAEIRKGAGTQFDPKVVDVFLALIREEMAGSE